MKKLVVGWVGFIIIGGLFFLAIKFGPGPVIGLMVLFSILSYAAYKFGGWLLD